jgi:hypothetical protein
VKWTSFTRSSIWTAKVLIPSLRQHDFIFLYQ